MLLALVIDYWFDDVKSGNLFFLSPWMPLALCFYRLLLYVKKLACMLSVKTDMSSSPRTLRRATGPMWRSPRQTSTSTSEESTSVVNVKKKMHALVVDILTNWDMPCWMLTVKRQGLQFKRHHTLCCLLVWQMHLIT